MKHQELEGIQQAMMPIEYQVLSLDPLAPLYHQLQNIVEVGLSHGHLVWIDVIDFKCGEEKFTLCKIVGKWRTHHNWYLKPLQQLLREFRFMVACSL